MDTNMVSTIRDIYTECTNMLDDVTVPGLTISFWSLFVGFFMLVMCLKLLGIFMGLGIGGSFVNVGSGAIDKATSIGSSVDRIRNNHSDEKKGYSDMDKMKYKYSSPQYKASKKGKAS